MEEGKVFGPVWERKRQRWWEDTAPWVFNLVLAPFWVESIRFGLAMLIGSRTFLAFGQIRLIPLGSWEAVGLILLGLTGLISGAVWLVWRYRVGYLKAVVLSAQGIERYYDRNSQQPRIIPWTECQEVRLEAELSGMACIVERGGRPVLLCSLPFGEEADQVLYALRRAKAYATEWRTHEQSTRIC